jgi:hypothetical protein
MENDFVSGQFSYPVRVFRVTMLEELKPEILAIEVCPEAKKFS